MKVKGNLSNKAWQDTLHLSSQELRLTGAYQEGKFPTALQDEKLVLEKIWSWVRSQLRKDSMNRFILKGLRKSVEVCKERKPFPHPTILILGTSLGWGEEIFSWEMFK